jgi:cobalamin biosynthesis Mg chelatase CobN
MLVRKTRQYPRNVRPVISSKTLLRFVLLCGVLAVVAPTTALASSNGKHATVPCWKRLLNDWYDGTINNRYPIPCYRQAIKHLPLDVQVYSSAKEDILAAEQAAAAGKAAPPESQPLGTRTTNGSSGTESTETTTTTKTTTTPSGKTTTTTAVVVVPVTATKKKHGVSGLLADITPGDSQSFPLPLLILGLLAILLVIAGIGGMFWQRSHPRDDGPPPT